MWKATAAYNFFPTESSGMAPFFLMFGCRAAVKHTLLESKNPKYLGTDNSMINVGLMMKLYHVIAHNLHEARKARDGNKKGKTPREPEKLKIGDNILVTDHTSKAFQPKYKDFCIVGLLGKNQVEIKDNHGHTTKVHCKDVKKIPMTEKVCKLYEEKQIGKTREGRKAVPSNKMPDLGWDIAETQLQGDGKNIEAQKNQEDNAPHMTLPLQALIAVVIILVTILEHTTAYVKEIPKLAKKAAQVVKSTTTEANQSRLLQNIKDSYKTVTLVITTATNTRDSTNRSKQLHITNRSTHNCPGTRKPNYGYDGLYQSHTYRVHNDNDN